ncbi:hypothetical protein [Neobacillus cucumis]|uniref:Uncharacterized protein n=1 Tax=Neobacillus cucumis TaxID=1740721 RepID=A0A2N5HSQ5_9BACI|nr:hypothetical protein [Neobacillus cucumis]PLS08556.1 hypothetical protein CVD27_03930 [Neobacillus cucumis]
MNGLKKLVLTIALGLTIVSGVTIGFLGPALFQEGNPVPLLVSIVKLKLTDTDYVQFFNTEKKSRYLSSNSGNQPFKQVKEFMKSKGWVFEEQMGSGLIFLKDEKEAIVLTRQYSKYFVIWDVSQSVIR